MRAIICSALLVLGFVGPVQGWAQAADRASGQADGPADPESPEPSPELETLPEGSYLELQQQWPQSKTGRVAPLIDRRLEIDPMTGQSILWPTAYTAEAGTVTYTNFFLVGNTLSIAVTDDVTIGTTLVFPSAGAFHAQATGRIRVHDGPNHIVSVIPILHYQSEGDETLVTTSAVSTGIGVVSDFYITDRLMVGAGLHMHLTLSAATSSITDVECRDRDAFFNSECTEVAQAWESFPAGGHWLALVGHAIYYIDDWINLRAEVFTGGVAGTFMGTEYIYGRETLAQRSERYREGEFAIGIPYDSGITAGLGTGMTVGPVSVQFSGYAFYEDESLRLTPMFVGAVSF